MNSTNSSDAGARDFTYATFCVHQHEYFALLGHQAFLMTMGRASQASTISVAGSDDPLMWSCDISIFGIHVPAWAIFPSLRPYSIISENRQEDVVEKHEYYPTTSSCLQYCRWTYTGWARGCRRIFDNRSEKTSSFHRPF